MPDPTYSIEELADAAVGFFGVQPPDVHGAFYGRAGSYTVAQAASILTAWLGASLPTPPAGGGAVILTYDGDPAPAASGHPDGILWVRMPAS